MCYHCYDGGCTYCEDSVVESNNNIELPKRSMKEIKRLRNTPDYEALQLNKQSQDYTQ